jgi:hypothetical protein
VATALLLSQIKPMLRLSLLPFLSLLFSELVFGLFDAVPSPQAGQELSF